MKTVEILSEFEWLYVLYSYRPHRNNKSEKLRLVNFELKKTLHSGDFMRCL